MTKQETIQEIKKLLSTYGCFSIGELDDINVNPCVGSIGSVVGLAEYFTEDYVEVNVYHTNSFSSDSIESYESVYELLDDAVLQDILSLCQDFEAQTLQTEKRISNEQ
jgi:hypothetical protein